MATLVRGRMGGTEVFTDELVPRITQRLKSEDPYSSILQVVASAEKPYDIESELMEIATPAHGTGGFSRAINFLYLRFTSLKNSANVAFYPFTAVIPRIKKPTKTVVTIHDLQHRDLPNLFSRSQKIYRRFTYERPAKKADAIIVISDFTKQSVLERLKVSDSMVHRIYPGMDHEFFSFTPRKDWHLAGEGFLYFPARGLPHKNHARLFAAMVIVRETYPKLRLKLTGADANALGTLPDFVQHEGHVTRARVLELYKTADALVFPSLYEGFGLPPIEAMAVGCPVISSGAGSLLEVCGDGATIVDPLSPESIAFGILKTLASPELTIEAGRINAARFDWDVAAEQHVNLFHKLTG